MKLEASDLGQSETNNRLPDSLCEARTEAARLSHKQHGGQLSETELVRLSTLWCVLSTVEACTCGLPSDFQVDDNALYRRIVCLPHLDRGTHQIGYAIGRVNHLAADLHGHAVREGEDPAVTQLVAEICNTLVKAKILPILRARDEAGQPSHQQDGRTEQ